MQKISGQIFQSIIRDLFDMPIMGNVYRAVYVERMIITTLGDGFKLTSADWAGWDVEHDDGVRLEIKQSAARQTWTDRPSFAGKPTSGAFDIAPRAGYWSDGGSKWIEEPGRPADIYIFAWHPVTNAEVADHRDPDQWEFFVVQERELPPVQKTISRTVVEKNWSAFGFDALRDAVQNTIRDLQQHHAAKR